MTFVFKNCAKFSECGSLPKIFLRKAFVYMYLCNETTNVKNINIPDSCEKRIKKSTSGLPWFTDTCKS